MALLNFDATGVPQQQTFDPLPAGWYPVMITQSEVKSTKANDGSTRLDLTFTVFDGPHKGRKIFNTLNIGNQNPVAREIAQKQLSSICHAVNVLNVSDSTMLHEKPLSIRLKIRPADGNYEASNDVSGYKAYEAASAAPQGGFVPPVAPAGFQPSAAPAPAFQAPVQPATPAFVAPAPAQAAPVAAAPVVAPPGWSQDANGQWVQAPVAVAPAAPVMAQQPWQQPQVEAAPAPAPAPTAAVPPWAQPPQ